MSESAQSGPQSRPGRVKWKRFAVVMVPAAIVAAALIGLTAKGAIAANISVSGKEYLVTATELQGTGFEQFGSTVPQGNGGSQPVAVSAIKSADLTSLCQAVSVGGITLLLRAGTGSQHVHADNLIVDASDLSGNATFTNIAIGQDAGTLNAVQGAVGPAQNGQFGEQAGTIDIKGLIQHTWLTTAGTFTLPNLHLTVTHGGSC
jgi:Family of unknown function (DUF6230)